MSKKSSIAISNLKDIIPVPPQHINSTRNFLINSKNNSKSKDKKNNYKMKFSYIPKNNSLKNHTEYSSNNILDSKNNNSNPINKEKDNLKDIYKNKNINYTNNNEKKSNIISIFDPKKLQNLNNNERNNNKNISTNYVLISNNRKNSKGNILIYGNNRTNLPKRYHLNIDNINSNNSILIANKISPENKGKIIRVGEKIPRITNKNKEKGSRIITIEDISIVGDNNRKSLKKCLSKPNYTSDYNNNKYYINNYVKSEFNESFNTEKIKKHRSIKEKFKNNNSFQNQASKRDIYNKGKSNIQTYSINIKNRTQILDNKNNMSNYQNRTNQNIIKDNTDKERSINRSKSKKFSGEVKMKNQINNNNININNVYINLDNKNKDYFNKESEYSQLIREDLSKNSYCSLYTKSYSNKDLSLNSSQILKDIKKLWANIGGVTEHYKLNFIEKMNHLNNEEKIYFYIKEREEIDKLLNLLEKLNKNIKIRNNINLQLKNINNNNNYMKIEDISKLLISLRMTTVEIINNFINFKKEISYDIFNNKFMLQNINNYPYNYLIQIENDTRYLHSHPYLSNIYQFSKYSDPFLLCPSKESKDKNNKYMVLPIIDYTLQDIQKANYYLIKEKINREERKRSLIKSPSNYCNNAILIRNNNIVKRMNENRKIKIYNKDKFENIFICSNICNFDIVNKKENKNISIEQNSTLELINNNIKIFNKNINQCSNVSYLEYTNDTDKSDKKYNYNNICSKISHFEIIAKHGLNNDNICFCNNYNFEIIDDKKKILQENSKNNLICPKVQNFEIKTNNNRIFSKNIYPCSKIIIFEIFNNNNLKNLKIYWDIPKIVSKQIIFIEIILLKIFQLINKYQIIYHHQMQWKE